MKEVATRNKINIKLTELENARNEVVLLIPNIPNTTVPIGPCYNNNCCVKTYSNERKFDFAIKEHMQMRNGYGYYRL